METEEELWEEMGKRGREKYPDEWDKIKERLHTVEYGMAPYELHTLRKLVLRLLK